MVSALATFQVDTRRGGSASRSAAVGRTVTTRPLDGASHQIGPLGRDDLREDGVASSYAAGRVDNPSRCVDIRGLVRRGPTSSSEGATVSTRTSTCLADPVLGPLGDELVGQCCDPGNPFGDRLLVELARHPDASVPSSSE